MIEIAAGIVLYNPDLDRLKENIDAIYDQVKILVLIDNNSNNIDLIAREYSTNKKVVFIKNKSNFGIAKALNQLMTFCKSRGYKWVLTLDQDSVCPPNMIEEYMRYIDVPKVAILSPIVDDRNMSKDIEEKDNENSYELIDDFITSAALTNVSIWNKIGGFDEEMFIDLVDSEYAKRLKLNDFKIIKVNTVVLLHELGNLTRHKFFFRDIYIMNHSAFRKYYMARNVLYCAKKYKESGGVIKAYKIIFNTVLATLIYEQNKWEKISKVIQGMVDARKLK